MPELFRHQRHVRAPRIQPERPSPRARGYDAKWDRRSAAFRRRHPFCQRCQERAGAPLVFCVVVDHKFPVQDGGKVHCDDAGLWSLCAGCHGWKLEFEAFARRTGQMHMIVEWCDHPEKRPEIRRGDLR